MGSVFYRLCMLSSFHMCFKCLTCTRDKVMVRIFRAYFLASMRTNLCSPPDWHTKPLVAHHSNWPISRVLQELPHVRTNFQKPDHFPLKILFHRTNCSWHRPTYTMTRTIHLLFLVLSLLYQRSVANDDPGRKLLNVIAYGANPNFKLNRCEGKLNLRWQPHWSFNQMPC